MLLSAFTCTSDMLTLHTLISPIEKEKHQPVTHPEEILKELDAIPASASKELAG